MRLKTCQKLLTKRVSNTTQLYLDDIITQIKEDFENYRTQEKGKEFGTEKKIITIKIRNDLLSLIEQVNQKNFNNLQNLMINMYHSLTALTDDNTDINTITGSLNNKSISNNSSHNDTHKSDQSNQTKPVNQSSQQKESYSSNVNKEKGNNSRKKEINKQNIAKTPNMKKDNQSLQEKMPLSNNASNINISNMISNPSNPSNPFNPSNISNPYNSSKPSSNVTSSSIREKLNNYSNIVPLEGEIIKKNKSNINYAGFSSTPIAQDKYSNISPITHSANSNSINSYSTGKSSDIDQQNKKRSSVHETKDTKQTDNTSKKYNFRRIEDITSSSNSNLVSNTLLVNPSLQQQANANVNVNNTSGNSKTNSKSTNYNNYFNKFVNK